MKIEDYTFGTIQINGNVYSKDLWVINGKIDKRDKSIAKSKFGTSHKICAKELKKIVTKNKKSHYRFWGKWTCDIDRKGIKVFG